MVNCINTQIDIKYLDMHTAAMCCNHLSVLFRVNPYLLATALNDKSVLSGKIVSLTLSCLACIYIPEIIIVTVE